MNKKTILISVAVIIFAIIAGVALTSMSSKKTEKSDQKSNTSSKSSSVQSSVNNSSNDSSTNSSQNQSNLPSTTAQVDGLISNQYLPSFKAKYDSKIWTKSDDFEFILLETFPPILSLNKRVALSNPAFNLEIGGTLLPDGGGFTCYKTEDFTLKTFPNDFFMLVPKDTSKLENYKFTHKNQLKDLTLLSEDKELKEYIDGGENCDGAKYVTINAFVSTKFDDEKAKKDFNAEFDSAEKNRFYLDFLFKTTKTPTDQDFAELSTLLKGIEGLEY